MKRKERIEEEEEAIREVEEEIKQEDWEEEIREWWKANKNKDKVFLKNGSIEDLEGLQW